MGWIGLRWLIVVAGRSLGLASDLGPRASLLRGRPLVRPSFVLSHPLSSFDLVVAAYLAYRASSEVELAEKAGG
jgi:hypothetical protein